MQKPKHKKWTEDEKTLLIKHYADMTAEELLKLLPNCTAEQIRNKSEYLKLRKSRVFKQKQCKIIMKQSCNDQVRLSQGGKLTLAEWLRNMCPVSKSYITGKWGLARRSVNRLYEGGHEPTFRTLCVIADISGMKLSELLHQMGE